MMPEKAEILYVIEFHQIVSHIPVNTASTKPSKMPFFLQEIRCECAVSNCVPL